MTVIRKPLFQAGDVITHRDFPHVRRRILAIEWVNQAEWVNEPPYGPDDREEAARLGYVYHCDAEGGGEFSSWNSTDPHLRQWHVVSSIIEDVTDVRIDVLLERLADDCPGLQRQYASDIEYQNRRDTVRAWLRGR